MLIYIDLSVLSATRNYDLEGKDSHCVEVCTQPDLKGLSCIPGWLLFPEAVFVECRVSATQTGPVYGAVTARPGLVTKLLSAGWALKLVSTAPHSLAAMINWAVSLLSNNQNLIIKNEDNSFPVTRLCMKTDRMSVWGRDCMTWQLGWVRSCRYQCQGQVQGEGCEDQSEETDSHEAGYWPLIGS